MAISDSQKIDLLWKKVGFGKAKTDTNDNKKAPNEAINSDFVVKTSQIWAQSDSVPGVIPNANSSIVNVYSDSITNALETSEDTTSTAHRNLEDRCHKLDITKFWFYISVKSVMLVQLAKQIFKALVYSYLKLVQVVMTNGTLIINQVHYTFIG